MDTYSYELANSCGLFHELHEADRSGEAIFPLWFWCSICSCIGWLVNFHRIVRRNQEQELEVCRQQTTLEVKGNFGRLSIKNQRTEAEIELGIVELQQETPDKFNLA